MNILAVESSGKVASVAIWHENKIVYEVSLGDQLTHSQTLLPMVEQALEATQIDIDAIDCFAIDIGPGSFTGLRIGICSTNAMAFANNKKVIGFSSLEILAMNAAYFSGLICPLIDARNDQVYAAVYQWKGNHLKEIISPFAGAISEWLEKLPNDIPCLFLGDGAIAQREVITSVTINAEIALAYMDDHSASSLAMLAAMAPESAFKREIQPFYLRASQAERMRASER